MCPALLRPARHLPELDLAVSALATRRTAFPEEDVLQPIWVSGEEIRMHEDSRFRRTPWGRWVLAEWRLANPALEKAILRGWDGRDLDGRLRQLDLTCGGYHVLDPDDPRFHIVDISHRLVLANLPLELWDSEQSLSNSVEVFSIPAAAGRFGTGESADSKGFVGLTKLPKSHCFIVQAKGRSMEPEIPSGSYLLVHRTTATDGVVVAYHPDFQDDLGSCVVKRWVNGRLDSDHPDYRSRQLLTDEKSWEDVRVLGQVVQVLEPIDFPGLARMEPSTATRAGTQEERRLCAFDELEALRQQLISTPSVGASKNGQTANLAASLELAADAQSLRLRTPPMDLDAAIVSLGGHRTPGSNLRYEKVWRVWPQTTPYALELADKSPFELAAGLEGESATLFTAPLQGRSRRLKTRVVHGEGGYRCLVPPTRQRFAPPPPPWAKILGEIADWQVLELAPPGQLLSDDLGWLDWMGLAFEPLTLQLLLETVPAAFHLLPSGGLIPVVRPDQPVVLQLWSQEPMAASLLVATHDGHQECLSLTNTGEENPLRVALEDCPTELTLVRAQSGLEFSPTLLIWVGEPEHQSQVASDLQVTLAGKCIQPGTPLDLSASWQQVRISAPPLWPVHLDAGGPAAQRVRLNADADGNVGLAGTLAILERQWKDQWFGQLQVTAPALCSLALYHAAPPSESDLARRLQELVDSIEDFELMELWEADALRELWLLPTLKILGYGLQQDGEDPVWLLTSPILLGEPLQVYQELGALFTLSDAGSAQEIEAEADHLRSLMRRHQVSRGFASNGRYWLCVERSRRRPCCLVDVLNCLEGDGLLNFCRLFGAES